MRHLIFFALSVLCSQLKAQDIRLDSANAAYLNGLYIPAIESYESILSGGVIAPELYYNLGNAYYKLGQLGQAILNYERALKLAPNDEDITYNLKLANLQTVDKIEAIPELIFVRWKKDIANMLSMDTWAILLMASIFLFFCICILFVVSGKPAIKKILLMFCVPTIVLSYVFFSFAQLHFNNQNNSNAAILMTPSVTVKSAPKEDSKSLFVIHEGIKVAIDERIGDWCKIIMLNGNEGWVLYSNIELI